MTLRDKTRTLAEIAALVPDGARLALGGFAVYQKPMAAVRALVRRGARDLTVVGAANSLDVDILAGAGALRRVETSYVGLETHGLANRFRRAAEGGTVEVVDYPEMASWDRFRASQEGLAFWPVGFLGGNDVLRNPDIKPFACPLTGRPMQAIPAANADVVVIHAIAADAQGNVVFPARRLLPQSGDVLMGRSCDRVLVTVERIVSKAFIQRHARLVELPSYRVEAVAEVPWGSHPTPTLGRYLADDEHIAAYAEASRTDDGFSAWLETYVTGPAAHADYLDLIGAARLASITDLDELL